MLVGSAIDVPTFENLHRFSNFRKVARCGRGVDDLGNRSVQRLVGAFRSSALAGYAFSPVSKVCDLRSKNMGNSSTSTKNKARSHISDLLLPFAHTHKALVVPTFDCGHAKHETSEPR